MLGYDDYLKECEGIWTNFLENIKKELETLRTRLEEKEIISEKFAKLFDGLSSIESIIKSKDSLLKFDPSLGEYIDALVFFNDKNNLENLMAKDSFEKINESEKVKKSMEVSESINKEIESHKSKIDKLASFVDNFYSISDILEYAKAQQLDEEKIKSLLFYSLYEISKGKRKSKNDTEEKDNKIIKKESKRTSKIRSMLEENEVKLEVQEEASKENEEQIVDIPNPIVSEVAESNEEQSEETQVEEEETPIEEGEINLEFSNDNITSSYNVEYEEKKNLFYKLQNDNKELLDKYNLYLKESNNEYTSYISYKISELVEMGIRDDLIARVIIYKLLETSREINSQISDLSTLTDSTEIKNAHDYIIAQVEEYENLVNSLIEIDSRLSINDDEVEEDIQNKNVFFAHEENNSLLIPNEEIYRKKLNDFANKYDNNLGQVKVNIKRMLGAEKEAQRLGKTIYMLNTPNSLSYVKINYNDEEAIFVITAGPREGIKDYTREVISDFEKQIINQIKLIEEKNEEEIKNQQSIKRELDESLTGNIGMVL